MHLAGFYVSLGYAIELAGNYGSSSFWCEAHAGQLHHALDVQNVAKTRA
jgi:hypothetical protein